MDATHRIESLAEETLRALGPILQYAGAGATLGMTGDPQAAVVSALIGGAYGARQAWRRAEEAAEAVEEQDVRRRWLRAQLGRLYATDAALGRQLLELGPAIRADSQLLETMAQTLHEGLAGFAADNEELRDALSEAREDAQAFLGQILHHALETLRNTRELLDVLGDDAVGVQSLDRLLKASDQDATPQLLRPSGPQWIDLAEGVPHRRAEVDEVLRHVSAGGPTGALLISGEASSGKSVVARYSGFLLALEGRAVLHADMRTLMRRSGRNLRDALAALRAALRQATDVRPLFIIEDLHRVGQEDAVGLLEELDLHPLTADVVLTSRPISDPLDGSKNLLEECARDLAGVEFIRLDSNVAGEWLDMARHIWAQRWRLDHDAGSPEVPFELGETHLQQIHRKGGHDLWLLTFMLRAHGASPSEPFSAHSAAIEIAAHLEGRSGYRSLADRAGISDLNVLQQHLPLTTMLATSMFSRWEMPVECDFLCDLLADERRRPYQVVEAVLSQLVESRHLNLSPPAQSGAHRWVSLHSGFSQAVLVALHEYGTTEALGVLREAAVARVQQDTGELRAALEQVPTTLAGLSALLWAAYVIWAPSGRSMEALVALVRASLPLVVRWPVPTRPAAGIPYEIPMVYCYGLPPAIKVRESHVSVPLGLALMKPDSLLYGNGWKDLAALTHASPVLMRRLAECIESLLRGEDERAAAGTCCLIALGGLQATNWLAGILATHPSAQARFAAGVEIVSMMHEVRGRLTPLRMVTDALLQRLSDPEPAVRAICARGLGFSSGQKTCEALTRCLTNDSDEWPRCEAAVSLANLGCVSVLPDIEEMKGDFATPSLWFHADMASEALRTGRQIHIPRTLNDVMPGR